MKQETYDKIWTDLIQPTFGTYENKTGKLLCPVSGKEEIFTYYTELNAYAKAHYMAEGTSRLNRHKVCAGMMIAILKAKPIKKIDPIYYQPDHDGKMTVWPYNESLAVTVGLSILRAFILKRQKDAFSGKAVPRKVFDGVCKEDAQIFANGIPITDKERKEWEWELYQIRQDGAYNLLTMAHVLSGIEKAARLQYFMDHRDIEPTSPTFTDEDEIQVEDDVNVDELL